MAQGIRKVPANDKARFWQAIHSGHTTQDACRIAGVHPNTGYNWIKKSKVAKANADVAAIELTKHTRRQGGVQWEAAMDLAEAGDLPPAIPLDRLTPEAQRGLEDFQFFREHYLGRVSAPWQVEAALEIVKSLDSEEKEFICLNVPPGAGKSTWVHNNKTGFEHVYNIDAIRAIKDMDVNAYTRHMRTKAIMAVENGSDLIADATHIMKTHRLIWLGLADRLQIETRLVVFDTRRELLLQAQQIREFPVKNSVVIEHHRKLQLSKNEVKREGWGSIEVITR